MKDHLQTLATQSIDITIKMSIFYSKPVHAVAITYAVSNRYIRPRLGAVEDILNDLSYYENGLPPWSISSRPLVQNSSDDH